jgi:uncharacterized cupredoxin-like copper-binding protein
MSSSPKLVTWMATLALAAVPIAAGCGDDDDDEGETTAAETSATETTGGGGGGETVSVSETDFALNPPNPTVKAGTVTFDVTNDGQTEHSLEVEGPGEESELDAELAPGDSGTLEVDLSKPGTYEWYCPVDDHKGMGMRGEITVE